MIKALIDINVVLDVLLDRAPHVAASAAIWAAAETGKVEGLLAGHAVTTIQYLIRKDLGTPRSKQTITAILQVFAIAPVDGRVLLNSLRLQCPDFEDAVTAAAASGSGCDYVVTRDPKGFRGSPIRVLTPEAALPLFLRP